MYYYAEDYGDGKAYTITEQPLEGERYTQITAEEYAAAIERMQQDEALPAEEGNGYDDI